MVYIRIIPSLQHIFCLKHWNWKFSAACTSCGLCLCAQCYNSDMCVVLLHCNAPYTYRTYRTWLQSANIAIEWAIVVDWAYCIMCLYRIL